MIFRGELHKRRGRLLTSEIILMRISFYFFCKKRPVESSIRGREAILLRLDLCLPPLYHLEQWNEFVVT